MSAVEVLSRASAEDIVLVLEDDRLTWTADHQAPVDLLISIEMHGQIIIAALMASNDLSAEAQSCLTRVACLLECSPGYLLEHGCIYRHDLAEQRRIHPSFVVPLGRSNFAWVQELPSTPGLNAPELEYNRIRCALTAARTTSEWCRAHDRYRPAI